MIQLHWNILPYFFLIGLMSCSTPPQSALNDSTPKVGHFLVIGIDGMSPNGIQTASTPTLDSLMNHGASTLRARAVLPTSSSPNWASMIMGAGPEQHGITSNAWERDFHKLAPANRGAGNIFPTIFQLIRNQQPKAEIGAIYDWGGFGRLFEKDAVSYDINGKDEYETTTLACKYLKEKDPLFTFIHLDHVDHAGHAHRHGSPEYYASVEVADSLIGAMLAAAHLAFGNDFVVLVTADHGGKGLGHGGETLAEIEIPFILAGKGIKSNYSIPNLVMTYDNAATVAYTLGITQPHSWIGRPVKSAFMGSDAPETLYAQLPPPQIFIGEKAFKPSKDSLHNEVTLSLVLDVPGAAIHYTLDGSTPNERSPLYDSPLIISPGITLRAVGIQKGREPSAVVVVE